MKLIIFSSKIFLFLFIVLKTVSLQDPINLGSTYYYEEKFFRILSNNYEDIIQGEFWDYDEESEGFGFKANKDYGSLIFLKDWSMHNFKLTKVIFRKSCNFKDFPCNAEMWLIHTKDNGYYPPGRRIYIKQNYFIIVVPFVKANDNNPAVDMILDSLNLDLVEINTNDAAITKKVTPKKPVKLYKIIQNQPSILFEGTYKQKETLFLVFTQYHFISEKHYTKLDNFYKDMNKDISNYYNGANAKLYRNVKNEDDIQPKVTLMSYSKASFLNTVLPFLILFLF
jgi:hypothetical protein